MKVLGIGVLTFSGLSSSRLRKVLILMMETAPWIIDTIPKGSKKSGPLIVLKSVRDTNAVSESKMLLTGSTRTNVANEAKATNKINRYLRHVMLVFSLMCSSSHIWRLEIFDEPRNCCQTWDTLVVVFLNCSCEINFRAPSRLQDIEKVSWLEKKIFHSDSFFFFDTAKNKKSK